MTTNYIQYFLLVAISVICYYNCCNCGFAFDDISAIRDNKDITPNVPVINLFKNDFWGTRITKEQSHKSYRPLTVLTFKINYILGKLNPFGYHLLNLFLHSFVCVLYKKVLQLFLNNEISFASAMVFAVHPIHTEAVTGVVGRAELLSSIFSLLTFLSYDGLTKKSFSMSKLFFIVSLVCAVLCKEQGITISAICVVYELFLIQQITIYNFLQPKHLMKNINSDGTLRIFFVLIVTFALLVARVCIMGSQLPVFTRFDNPASATSFPTKQLTYGYLIYLNLMLLFYPSNLCCDWTMGTIPLITNFSDVRNLLTFITLCFFIILAYTIVYNQRGKNNSHSKVLIMALAFLTIPFLPAANLFFPVGFVIAERVLYMPSMGFCILIGYGFNLLYVKYKNKIINLFMILLILSYGTKTINRNLDWEDEFSIFTSGLKVNRNNAKLFNNVGHSLENKGQHLEALSYFLKATEIQKDDIGAYINVGRAYKSLKMYDKAEQAYLTAKQMLPKPKQGETYQARVAPNHLSVFLNLASLISLNQSRLEEADLLYRQAISMRADYVQAYINRGDVLMKLNRVVEAQKVYEEALKYDHENADIHYNLGVVLLNQNNTENALTQFELALKFNPEHEQALFNSAVLLQELNQPKYRAPAYERLLKLLDFNKGNDRVYFNLGMLSMDENKTNEAVFYFKKAIELKKDFRSALFNLALLLADSKRPVEAIPFLKQLMLYYPNHIKGLILLGDIYVNNIRDLNEAEKCYNKILHYEPNNIQGLHNLCVVYVEKNELNKALNCLEKAHFLAPEEEYIYRHLNIIRAKVKKKPNES
ncbi:protein O-mannosyl-transferase Tmtc3 [Condylostylus longicornis]|uniref:protein O-mannosyl-transferase Tmtc3 n=1 Tax=Condylostylus longicornis TaxID=2530218 RepID=UPI00244E54B6|nr:protein O-mannosyl-transferase Tmtc3 [Condylostylus longicornis]